jgi:flavin-dependent dehydrogenase
MEHCDVLIVGGGPGGSSCARRLSGAGLDVVVLDKAVFPRDKVCAGWITPAVLGALQLDPADYAQGRVLQPITAFRVGRGGGPMIDLEYREPVSYGIRRCEFDHYLLDRCGARLRLGESVRSIARDRDGWVINNHYRTPMLVGAGGHFCPVAQSAGKTRDPLAVPVVAAQEIEFLLDDAQQAECKVEGHRPELYFCRDLLGYGWCFRKGSYLNVGLGREDRDQLPEHVADFCEHLKQQGRIPRNLPGKFRGHAYLLYDHSPRELAGDGVLLVGDAAGLAYTKSGEGIRPAIESGLLAADVILAAGGDYGRASLEPYRARLESRFGRRGPPSPPARSAPSRLRRLIAATLLANRWFVRHVVIQRWFLHWDQPPLRRDPLFFRSASP